MLLFFFSFLLLLPLFFLSAQICLSNHCMDSSMVDMDVKLYNRVSKFKMSDSKTGTLAFPKPPKFCPHYFPLTKEVIVLKLF